MLVCGLAAFSINGFKFNAPAQTLEIPEGYTFVKTLDLSAGGYTHEPILSFTLDQPRTAGIFIGIQSVKSDLIDLQLTGPDGYQRAVFHAEGYTADQEGVFLEEAMAAGQYQRILTSKPSTGTLSVYSKK